RRFYARQLGSTSLRRPIFHRRVANEAVAPVVRAREGLRGPQELRPRLFVVGVVTAFLGREPSVHFATAEQMYHLVGRIALVGGAPLSVGGVIIAHEQE